MYLALILDAKIKDILPGKSGYNLYLKVVSKNVLVDLTRFDKTRVVIADFIVGDETGIIKMRLRNGKF
jgi:ssDNA-binding replication factor A large subunit